MFDHISEVVQVISRDIGMNYIDEQEKISLSSFIEIELRYFRRVLCLERIYNCNKSFNQAQELINELECLRAELEVGLSWSIKLNLLSLLDKLKNFKII